MFKQLTIIFWCFVYGEVLGYIGSSLLGTKFNFLYSALVPIITGWIFINIILMFIKNINTKDNKK